MIMIIDEKMMILVKYLTGDEISKEKETDSLTPFPEIFEGHIFSYSEILFSFPNFVLSHF